MMTQGRSKGLSLNKQNPQLKSGLNALLLKSPPRNRIQLDPIEFPRRYQDPKEIEVVSFLAAILAYGRVSLFKPVIEKILALSNGNFYDYLIHFDGARERPRFEGIYYRFNTTEDLFILIALMSEVVREYGTIGTLFTSLYQEEDDDIGPTLSRFIAKLSGLIPDPMTRGLRHLFPSPEKGSACKRFNLFLRWMIRPNDGIDFGLWCKIPPSKLIIPLDTHIVRIGTYLNLSTRKSPNWKMAKEITEVLKACNPLDPLKYDFPLCHLGMSGACPIEMDHDKCQVCPLQKICKRLKTDK